MAAEHCENWKETTRVLDETVARFCAAAGEPIPEDAIAEVERMRARLRTAEEFIPGHQRHMYEAVAAAKEKSHD